MKNATTMRIAKKDLPKLESLYMSKFRSRKAYVLFCAEGFKFSNNSRLMIHSTQQGIREAIKNIVSVDSAEALEIERRTSSAQSELERLNYLIPTLEYNFRFINDIDWTGKKKPSRMELYNQIIECQNEHEFLLKNCIITEPRLDIFDLKWLMKKVDILASEKLATGEYKYRVVLSRKAYHKDSDQREFFVTGNHNLFGLLTMAVEYKED